LAKSVSTRGRKDEENHAPGGVYTGSPNKAYCHEIVGTGRGLEDSGLGRGRGNIQEIKKSPGGKTKRHWVSLKLKRNGSGHVQRMNNNVKYWANVGGEESVLSWGVSGESWEIKLTMEGVLLKRKKHVTGTSKRKRTARGEGNLLTFRRGQVVETRGSVEPKRGKKLHSTKIKNRDRG